MIPLADISACLQGAIPSGIASVSGDGVPNVTYVSQVHTVDAQHVAFSYQFLSKTYRNLSACPGVTVWVMNPADGRQFELQLSVVRIEREGPVFDEMRLALQAIASQSGMTDIFRLKGSVICKVEHVRLVEDDGGVATDQPVQMRAVADATAQIARATDLDSLFQATATALAQTLGFRHCVVYAFDHGASTLIATESRGYGAEWGAEVSMGDGLVGMCAQEQRSMSVADIRRAGVYGEAIKARERDEGSLRRFDEALAPHLESLASQLTVPIALGGQLLGVVSLQSTTIGRFTDTDRQVIEVIAGQLAPLWLVYQRAPGEVAAAEAPLASPLGRAVALRFFREDESMFIGEDYLIRGLAGCILNRLIEEWLASGRTDWTNRELRADPSIQLPPINDNLETRLILLRKRLDSREAPVRIEKMGRGRFRLLVHRPVTLSHR
jgi:adenylate cyclase